MPLSIRKPSSNIMWPALAVAAVLVIAGGVGILMDQMNPARVQGSTSATKTAPAAKPVLFKFSSFTVEPDMYLDFYNDSTATVDLISGEVQIVRNTDGSVRETRPFVMKFIDPGKGAASNLHFDPDFHQADYTLVVREIAVCKVDGKYINDCGDYVGALDVTANIKLSPR